MKHRTRLQTDWTNMVGPTIASVAKPLRLRYGTLVIGCTEVAAGEFQRLSNEFIARVNAGLGHDTVQRLRFVPPDADAKTIALAITGAKREKVAPREREDPRVQTQVLSEVPPFALVTDDTCRLFLRIPYHLRFLATSLPVGVFDRDVKAWTVAAADVPKAQERLQAFLDTLPDKDLVLSEQQSDIAHELEELALRRSNFISDRFVTSEEFATVAVALGTMQHAALLWRSVYCNSAGSFLWPEEFCDRTRDVLARIEELMVEAHDLAVSSPEADLHSEQILLGSILRDPRLLPRVAYLRAKHFADPVHGAIYAVMLAATERGETPTVAMVAQHIDTATPVEGGSADYLRRMLSASPSMRVGETLNRAGHRIRAMWLARQRVAARPVA
jgi:hypothetical protein